ncbi:MAG: hypothetical protein K2K60_04715 [Clostridia bacterium]|nr:hypothetical protein [Clostridia bacterium]
MKKKILFFVAAVCMLLPLFVCACDAREAGSLKSITRPYIAHYECTEATLGNENLLDKFEYINVVLVNKDTMQIIYKPKNGKKQINETKYTFDNKTHELSAEVGIYGFKFKQSTIVENGKFTVSKQIGAKQLIMKFKAK